MVAVAHQEAKSGLVKVHLFFARLVLSTDVLVQLLPLLRLPTPSWNELVRISRNHSLHLNMAQTGLARLENPAFFKL